MARMRMAGGVLPGVAPAHARPRSRRPPAPRSCSTGLAPRRPEGGAQRRRPPLTVAALGRTSWAVYAAFGAFTAPYGRNRSTSPEPSCRRPPAPPSWPASDWRGAVVRGRRTLAARPRGGRGGRHGLAALDRPRLAPVGAAVHDLRVRDGHRHARLVVGRPRRARRERGQRSLRPRRGQRRCRGGPDSGPAAPRLLSPRSPDPVRYAVAVGSRAPWPRRPGSVTPGGPWWRRPRP